MSAPFDALQLARGFEAAGFPLDQASKMAEAIAQATIGADLATTKRDLGEMELRLKKQIRLGGMLIVVVAALLLTGLGTATTIIFNRLSATMISAPASRASLGSANIVQRHQLVAETAERLARIEAMVARIDAAMAIKADLAGVARNVDFITLGRQLREMRDELRVTSAMLLRLDCMWPDIIEQLRAMMQQQLGILDRLRALEEPPA
jgi:hypothetical protein